ncbi:hypothetical protein CTEN210_05209 [Chaetoceros tenuissimus]|uniref:Peptidase A1 domain-containing protein n=1 Tax=Chaetoceros tenuissimus TaxID=426638 RepID=A0AAD3CN36_9STRA|nr:hypothetical protein CTEN210_05209 [Chaetoceros tenuissimus]
MMKRIPDRIKDVDDDENDSFEGHNLRSSLHKELVEDKVSEWSNPTAILPQEFSEDLLRSTLRRSNGLKYKNMKSTPERIKASKIEYTSFVDDQDTKHDMGKSALSARSNSNERQTSSNNYEANQIRKLNIERVRGVHYVEYAVGRPQQRLRFALALNSPYTVFRCSQYDCSNENCGVSTFNKYQSNTFVPIACDACGEGSCVKTTSGEDRCTLSTDEFSLYLARDFIQTEDGSFDMKFGCQIASNGFFNKIEQSAHGILGLSMASTSFLNQMFRADKIESTTFSICFESYNDRNLLNAGTLTLGGYTSNFLTSPMIYMENSKKDGKYTVIINNVYLREGGGQSVTPDDSNQNVRKIVFDKESANEGAGTVIDNTYQEISLNVEMSTSFRFEWSKMARRPFPNQPIYLPDNIFSQLPTVLIQMKAFVSSSQFTNPDNIVGMVGTKIDPSSPHDVLLAIPASHYMRKEPDGKYKMLLSLSNQDGSILGSSAFQGHHLLFKTGYNDVSDYIGIAEASRCSESPELMPSPPTPNPYSVRTESPISVGNNRQPTQSPIPSSPELGEKDNNKSSFVATGFETWHILVIIGVFGVILIALLALCCRRSYKKRKKKESYFVNHAALDSSDEGDGGESLVSFGLRSHLFSTISKSKVDDTGEQSGDTRPSSSSENDLRRKGTAQESKLVQDGQSYINEQFQPILPNAEPVLAEPIRNEPHVPSNNFQTLPSTNKSFLVNKNADTSDDEDGTYYSSKSRKHARRELQKLANNSRYEDGQIRDDVKDRTKSLPRESLERSNFEQRRTSVSVMSSSRNDGSRRGSGGNTKGIRRNSNDRGISHTHHDFRDSTPNGEPRRASDDAPRANRRRTMDLGLSKTYHDSADFDQNRQVRRRQTMGMGLSNTQHDRGDIERGSNMRTVKTSLDMRALDTNVNNTDLRRHSSSLEFASQSRSMEVTKRSTKARTLERAQRRSTMDFYGKNSGAGDFIPNFDRSKDREGTVIGLPGDEDNNSCVSGLTDIGRRSRNNSMNLSRSRHSSIDHSRRDSDYSDGMDKRRKSNDTGRSGNYASGNASYANASHVLERPNDAYDSNGNVSEYSNGDLSRSVYLRSDNRRMSQSGMSQGAQSHIRPRRRSNESDRYHDHLGHSEGSHRGRRSSLVSINEAPPRNHEQQKIDSNMIFHEYPEQYNDRLEDGNRRNSRRIDTSRSNGNRSPNYRRGSTHQGPPRTRDNQSSYGTSVESFQRLRMEEEMKERGMDAPPQYRIIQGGRRNIY